MWNYLIFTNLSRNFGNVFNNVPQLQKYGNSLEVTCIETGCKSPVPIHTVLTEKKNELFYSINILIVFFSCPHLV